MDELINQLKTLALTEAVPFLIKLGGALVMWFVGRTVISGFQRVLQLTMQKRKIDSTLIRYVESLFSSALTILLGLALLGVMGIETTSFAALLAAAGIAIGSAWSGLLSNFAAGVFLLVLRPFRVGDEINSGEVTGVVQEIGLFVTAIDTTDNLRIFVGNARLLGDNIINFSHHPHRKITVKLPLLHGADVQAVKRALEARVVAVPDVLSEPALSVEVEEFTVTGPVLAVQAWCKPIHANAVKDGMGQAIQEALAAAGYAIPGQQAPWVLPKAG
ncbi:mechanosensitive ion channel family protein [Hyalangium versicolor]|uniref:mechanosensitive ion channel family protein n=1 Tax=Hyalangium versicolor TaxID=2861190 RepID=UPI001CC9DA84|nr:mechanosensitive ion channel family protein [Hyalangium versicolor]